MPDLDSMQWHSQASCSDLHPDLFFSEIPEDVAASQRICATCPVKVECLEWATATKPEYGVWGGRLFSENPTPIKHGTYTGYVRGCRLNDCDDNGGCAGAKRRYSASARARAKANKINA